jgi:chromosome partitioning protein
MAVIAIANQKGGTAKTTTAVNLGACLAHAGRNVLLVDLDAQCNLTTHLGIDPPADERRTSYGLLTDKSADAAGAVLPVGPNLAVIPGHIALAEVDLKLHAVMNSHTRLKRAFAVLNREGYILIDCAPTLGLSTLNAFTAATHLIVAIQTNWFAYEALKRLMFIVDDVLDEANPDLVVYALATLHRANVNNNRDVLAKIEETFGDLTLRAIIRHTATLAEAATAGQSIVDYAHGSRGHKDYEALAEEIIDRVERNQGSKAQKTS